MLNSTDPWGTWLITGYQFAQLITTLTLWAQAIWPVANSLYCPPIQIISQQFVCHYTKIYIYIYKAFQLCLHCPNDGVRVSLNCLDACAQAERTLLVLLFALERCWPQTCLWTVVLGTRNPITTNRCRILKQSCPAWRSCSLHVHVNLYTSFWDSFNPASTTQQPSTSLLFPPVLSEAAGGRGHPCYTYQSLPAWTGVFEGQRYSATLFPSCLLGEAELCYLSTYSLILQPSNCLWEWCRRVLRYLKVFENSGTFLCVYL